MDDATVSPGPLGPAEVIPYLFDRVVAGGAVRWFASAP
jgi:hypothetical protein